MPDSNDSPVRGLSRREFLAYCGSLAVLIGLSETGAPRVAAALEEEDVAAVAPQDAGEDRAGESGFVGAGLKRACWHRASPYSTGQAPALGKGPV